MADKILPTPEQLRELLRYDPETGKLYWKERPEGMFSTHRSFRTWNTRFGGEEAFTATSTQGYKVGSVFDSLLRAHRVAWAIFYGEWPSDQVDHLNSNRSDNRIINLRGADSYQNRRNSGKRWNNTSGYKGVMWNKQKRKWQAEIKAGSIRKHLGFFENPKDGYAAYCRAADKIHGEFAQY